VTEAIGPTTVARFNRPPLTELLANRRWVRRQLPFPHYVAQNVFVEDFYARLHAEFERIQGEHPEAFSRGIPNYDAAATDVERYANGPLGVFVSREWHDLLEAVGGIRATGDITAALHHHDPGSRRGWPHNDLNPGWFGGTPAGPDEVRFQGIDGVVYRDGTRPEGISARQTVRGVSLLFYLGNGDWKLGDGGETGLYASYDSANAGPAALVPPINNSLMMFECTPYSLHGFLGANTQRNSVVMWLHRDKAEAVERWGEHSIVYW
jgi:hypothetical protein